MTPWEFLIWVIVGTVSFGLIMSVGLVTYALYVAIKRHK